MGTIIPAAPCPEDDRPWQGLGLDVSVGRMFLKCTIELDCYGDADQISVTEARQVGLSDPYKRGNCHIHSGSDCTAAASAIGLIIESRYH